MKVTRNKNSGNKLTGSAGDRFTECASYAFEIGNTHKNTCLSYLRFKV
jgi:hypothetical protein